MAQNRRENWEGQNGRPNDARATELLHLYIYDYCKKQKFTQAARMFSQEASVATEQTPPIDVSTGFLADWWGVFWDIYYAKTKDAQASKEATVQDEYHDFIRAKREEVLQQQRNFNTHQQQQVQQQQAQQAQQQQQAQQAQQAQQTQQQRRASELRVQSPQQIHGHLNSQMGRPSPAMSTASLPPNTSTTPSMQQQPLNNNTNNLVNTPMSANQHIPTSSTPTGQSPSFSPQQQRNMVVDDINTSVGAAPMVNQTMQQQQPMMSPAHRLQQQSAIIAAAMNSLGLSGRDQQSLTAEEKNALQVQIRRIHMNQANMMRNPNFIANNPQARLQMQQQMMLQQQQQQMLQQQQQQPGGGGGNIGNMNQSPQIDQRTMMSPAMNGQARPLMNQMPVGMNMQNPNLMNNFSTADMNMMLAQHMMGKNQMPGSLTPQQQPQTPQQQQHMSNQQPQ